MSQEKYIDRQTRRLGVPLGSNLKLRKVDLNVNEVKEMGKNSYASAVGNLMYAMGCTGPDIAHVVGSVSRFLANLGKEHRQAVK